MGTIVDVHCHLFNADDLPVRGFVRQTKLHNKPLADKLAWLADRYVQGKAPHIADDLRKLDVLLQGGNTGLEAAETLTEPQEEFERRVDATLAELRVEDEGFVEQLGAEVAAEEQSEDEAGLEGFGDLVGEARRALRWVKLFGRSRLDLCADFVTTFSDEVTLAIPLLVDLGTNLEDRAESTVEEQMRLFEKLSRASMLGVLPGGGRAHLHPFIGFDPLAQLRADKAKDPEKPLDIIARAVEQYGFVGVKVYPPMGWRPSGNVEMAPFLSTGDADAVNRIVAEFAGWCAQHDVPVTAHCNVSNHADPAYAGFGSPHEWRAVLEEHSDLRLNLGHFGGSAKRTPDDEWPRHIAALAKDFPNVYADVGNHKVHDTAVTDDYFALLRRLFADPETAAMADRVMYGSDWFMLAMYPENEQFLPRYRSRYEEEFGAPATEGFLGSHALRFLGFADPKDPENANARRLRDRYARYAPDRRPAWLTPVDRPGATQ